MNRASTTPASVACTPDFSTRTQSSAPESEIGREAAHAGRVEDASATPAAAAERQGQRQVGGVEDRDDEDGAEIVERSPAPAGTPSAQAAPAIRAAASTPSAKAMSVAAGIAQPRSAAASPALKAT